MFMVLTAINRNVEIFEAAIVGIIVLLLIGIVVMSRRRKKAARPKPAAEVPNYYADLQQQPQQPAAPDPFSTFGAQGGAQGAPSPLNGASSASPFSEVQGAAVPDMAPFGGAPSSWPPQSTWSPAGGATPQPEMAPAAEAPQAATATVAPQAPPPPGTPAGWLPDPGGAPDTLRYWDGNAWTQHFAQRS